MRCKMAPVAGFRNSVKVGARMTASRNYLELAPSGVGCHDREEFSLMLDKFRAPVELLCDVRLA
jgi:hypothetical protein